MAIADFYKGTDWASTSEPLLTRQFHLTDLWPQGSGDSKDTLEDGMHPVLAVGDQATDKVREHALTGVVVSYESAASLVQLAIATGLVVKQYVANIATYSGGNPNTWVSSIKIGQPVWVDDSAALDDGVTLSMSGSSSASLNNPLAGYVFYDQDEYYDSGIGGAGSAMSYPKTASGSSTENILLNVLLTSSF